MTRRETKTFEENQRRAKQLMKRALIGFRSQLDDELRPQGVTTAQLQVLHAIKGSPGSSGAQLARACYMTPQSMQGLIQKAEADGWIVRHKDKEKGRVLAASLTVAGEALLGEAETVIRRVEKKLWEGVSKGELAGMVEVLEQCLGNLGGA